MLTCTTFYNDRNQPEWYRLSGSYTNRDGSESYDVEMESNYPETIYSKFYKIVKLNPRVLITHLREPMNERGVI